jgi:hypothetical protein
MEPEGFTPKAEHVALYNELIEVVKRHADQITAMEILAVAANFVGQISALQNKSLMDEQMMLDLIMFNIEAGSKGAIRKMNRTEGNA